MRGLFIALALLTAASASAQVQSRPTEAPIVTAENESWYRLGEPLQFSGDLFYPAGARVFFNGNSMVRTGHYNGVPLYADTTLEPYSLVFVPVAVAPGLTGLGGRIYLAVSVAGGLGFLYLAARLWRSRAGDQPDKAEAVGREAALYDVRIEAKPARNLFAFSILYLMALFAALLVESMTPLMSL